MGQGKKVLVVDDNKQLVHLVSTWLKDGHYEVITAFDGNSALDAMAREKPDLVLLDNLMPGVSGFEVMTQIEKNDDVYFNTRFIIMTAKAEMEYLFSDFNIDKFLAKPFEHGALMVAVEGSIGAVEVDVSTEPAPEIVEEQTEDAPEEKEPEASEEDEEEKEKKEAEKRKANRAIAQPRGWVNPNMGVVKNLRTKKDTRQTIEEFRGPGNRVLLAGAQTRILEKLAQHLKTIQYEPELVGTAEEAIKKSLEGEWAFIFSEFDIEINQYDVFKFYNHAKENEKTRSIPFLSFCYTDVESENNGVIPNDRIVSFYEFDLSDLKKDIDNFIKKMSGEKVDEPEPEESSGD